MLYYYLSNSFIFHALYIFLLQWVLVTIRVDFEEWISEDLGFSFRPDPKEDSLPFADLVRIVVLHNVV